MFSFRITKRIESKSKPKSESWIEPNNSEIMLQKLSWQFLSEPYLKVGKINFLLFQIENNKI